MGGEAVRPVADEGYGVVERDIDGEERRVYMSKDYVRRQARYWKSTRPGRGGSFFGCSMV